MPEYKSPQSEPGTERHLLLVFLLMAVVIFGSQFFMKKYMPQPPASTAQPASAVPATPGVAATQAAAPAMVSAPGSGKQKSGKQPEQTAAAPSKQAPAESDTVVENGLYKITFTNRGAQVKSWVLKKFQDDSGKPLDLVNAAASAKYGLPLSLWTYDPALRDKLNSALYVPSEIRVPDSMGELEATKVALTSNKL